MARRKKGIVLTRLELAIMRVLWTEEPVPVRRVHERLTADGRDLAYNTVQTMLTVLKEKGVAQDRPGDGRANLWSSRLSRDAVSITMVDDLVERLFDGEVEPLVLQLVDSARLDDDQLAALRRTIDARLKDRRKRS